MKRLPTTNSPAMTGYVLNLAPTGMVPDKHMTPRVPIAPKEIVEEVIEGARLGVNMVHLHAREPDSGAATYRKELYAEIIEGIRSRQPELVVCVSTSGRKFAEFEQRSEVLELNGPLKPDFASLTLGSLNFARQASVNPPAMIQELAGKMLRRGIRPELEVFDLGMINYARYLIQKGLVPAPCYFNLMLGNIAGAQADPMALGLMVRELPDGAVWSAGGIGGSQLPANAMSLAAGGGVRIGLEDNIWYDRERTRLAGNLELVERVVGIGKALGRTPYSAAELRARLRLEAKCKGSRHAVPDVLTTKTEI